MRDVHCHILPGVDDGPRTMSESLLMLSAAMRAGVTEIVCTPHCCDPWFNFERMWQAFLQLKHRASAIPGAPKLSMGFEVDYYKLKKLGLEAAVQLGNDRGEFLLRLPAGTLPLDWEFWVCNLQRKGFRVIIAHPERCQEVQKDVEFARRFLLAGCELQISAGCMYGGLLDHSRRTAKKLVQAGMVSHLASDARCPSDYEVLTEAMEYFKRLTDSTSMENKSIEEVERECAQAEERAEHNGKRSAAFPLDADASVAPGATVSDGLAGEKNQDASSASVSAGEGSVPAAAGKESVRRAEGEAAVAGDAASSDATGEAVASVSRMGRHGVVGAQTGLADLPSVGGVQADKQDEAPVRGRHARLS